MFATHASKTCFNLLKFTLASLVHELCICTFLLSTLSTSVNRFVAKKRDSFRLYSHFHLRERLFARRWRLVGLFCVLHLTVSSFGLSERLSVLLHRDHGFFLLPSLRIPPIPYPSSFHPSANLLFRLLLCVVSLNFVTSYTRSDTAHDRKLLPGLSYIFFVGSFLNSCGLALRVAQGRGDAWFAHRRNDSRNYRGRYLGCASYCIQKNDQNMVPCNSASHDSHNNVRYKQQNIIIIICKICIFIFIFILISIFISLQIYLLTDHLLINIVFA